MAEWRAGVNHQGQREQNSGTHTVLVIKLQGLLFPNLLNWKHLSLPAIGVGGAQWFGGTESEFGSTVLPRRHQLNREVSRSLTCGTRLTVTTVRWTPFWWQGRRLGKQARMFARGQHPPSKVLTILQRLTPGHHCFLVFILGHQSLLHPIWKPTDHTKDIPYEILVHKTGFSQQASFSLTLLSSLPGLAPWRLRWWGQKAGSVSGRGLSNKDLIRFKIS